MGIYDDKVEQIDLKGQLKPFNINQLDRVMHIIGQRRLVLDTSSILTDEIPKDSHVGQSSNMNGLVRFAHTTNVCVKEYFLPILKFTCTSPATPMFCPLAIFTVTELLVNLYQ